MDKRIIILLLLLNSVNADTVYNQYGEVTSQTIFIGEYIEQYCVIYNPDFNNAYPCTNCTATIILMDLQEPNPPIVKIDNKTMANMGSGLYLYKTDIQEIPKLDYCYDVITYCYYDSLVAGAFSSVCIKSTEEGEGDSIPYEPQEGLGGLTDEVSKIGGYLNPLNYYNNIINAFKSLGADSEGGSLKKLAEDMTKTGKDLLNLGNSFKDTILNAGLALKQAMLNPSEFLTVTLAGYVFDTVLGVFMYFFLFFFILELFLLLYIQSYCYHILDLIYEFFRINIGILNSLIATINFLANIIFKVYGFMLDIIKTARSLLPFV